jgi:1-acyl-sn-glycerol-3-phosphate acyltransferase
LLFVANHRSNLDTFLLIALIPGLRGLAKSTLYYNFLFAPFMWITGFIPVEKGNSESFLEGLRKIKTDLFEKNIPVLIYPENTRCSKGSPKLNKWSQAIFKIATEADATIIPIAIKNTDGVLGKGDFLLTPFELIEIKMLKPIEVNQWKNSSEVSKNIHHLLELELT